MKSDRKSLRSSVLHSELFRYPAGTFLLPCGFLTTGAFAFHSGLEFCRNLVERCKHIFIFDLFWNLSIVTD